MPTYPLPRLAPTITDEGITAPPFEDLLASFQAKYRSLYGEDLTFDPSTPNAEELAFYALMQHDVNSACVAAYLSYSPTYARGVHLSRLVKLNGLTRLAGSNATIPVRLVGQAGTVIAGGLLSDDRGNLWSLPTVTIPTTGEVVTTATCQTKGNVVPGSFSMETVTRGWQSVEIAGTLAPGSPVELDPELRRRQALSTAGPALTTAASLRAGIAALTGVTRFAVYENDQAIVDPVNGLPPRSVAVVVDGLATGSAQDVAAVIANRKNLGVTTVGTTTELVVDAAGVPKEVSFYFATDYALSFVVSIHPRTGYVSTTGDQIVLALKRTIARHPIGETFYLDKAYSAANLTGDDAVIATGLSQAILNQLSNTYTLKNLYLARSDMRTPIAHSSPASAFVVENLANYADGLPLAIELTGDVFFQTVCNGVNTGAGTVSWSPIIPAGNLIPQYGLVYVQGDLAFALNEASTVGDGFVVLV